MTETKLSPRQAHFVSAMLAARTMAEAARQAGISDRTAYTYMNDPEVRAAISHGLDDILADATRRITGAVAQAITTLEAILQDPAVPPASRVAAARLILDAGPRYHQTLDLVTRVANLEDLQRSLEHEPDTSYG